MNIQVCIPKINQILIREGDVIYSFDPTIIMTNERYLEFIQLLVNSKLKIDWRFHNYTLAVDQEYFKMETYMSNGVIFGNSPCLKDKDFELKVVDTKKQEEEWFMSKMSTYLWSFFG